MEKHICPLFLFFPIHDVSISRKIVQEASICEFRANNSQF